MGISMCNLFDQKKVFDELTSVCQWCRLPCVCGRAAVVAVEEKAGSSCINGSGGDRWSRERQSRESGGDLENFGMKNKMTRCGLIFIGSKILEAVLNQNRC
jgi:hypothetical protein